MTEDHAQTIEELKAFQAELMGVTSTPWEPFCISAAFSSAAMQGEFLFTMQVWIDLDAVQSPVLLAQFPDENILPQLKAALAAFGHPSAQVDDLEPEEVVRLFELMIAAVKDGFSTTLKMRPPAGSGGSGGGDGFGAWLPIFTCLITQLGLSLGDARNLLVKQAMALIPAHRRNEGWTPAGETYADRDVPIEE